MSNSGADGLELPASGAVRDGGPVVADKAARAGCAGRLPSGCRLSSEDTPVDPAGAVEADIKSEPAEPSGLAMRGGAGASAIPGGADRE